MLNATIAKNAVAQVDPYVSQSGRDPWGGLGTPTGQARGGYLAIAIRVLLAFGGSAPTPALACASCGCSLAADAAMGFSSTPGWRIGLQYDYIDQDQLRSGTKSVSPSEVAAINDAGGSQEVERDTINRYITLGIGYRPNADWGLDLLLPYVDRSHTTYGDAPNPLTPDQISGASFDSLGDMKLIMSWQGLLPTHNLGLQFGVKLPTGDYGGSNASGTGTVGRNPVLFSSGPSAGEPLDTSLQAGTGTTDLIVGAYYYRAVSQNFDAFVSGQFQSAVFARLDRPGEDYRPGNQAIVSLGLRYEANPRIVPQLQLNISEKSPDQGALADVENSGGTVAYISPGMSASVMKNVQLYGFIQLPVYSHLGGYQLLPRWTATAGLSYAF